MKTKLSYIGLILLVLSVGVLFADMDKKNWIEDEFDDLHNDLKRIYVSLFNEEAMKATDARIQIATAGDKLAGAIESDATTAERSKYIQTLSNDIVAATHETKMSYISMAKKAGDETDRFTNMLYGDEKKEDMLSINVKMLSKECDRMVYKLLEEADASTADKKRIKEEYKNELKSAEIKLKNAYRTYAGFYLTGVTAGKDYEEARQGFSDAVTYMVTLTSDIYAKELGKLSPKEKARVIIERKALMKKQSQLLHEWVNEKKTEMNKNNSTPSK